MVSYERFASQSGYARATEAKIIAKPFDVAAGWIATEAEVVRALKIFLSAKCILFRRQEIRSKFRASIGCPLVVEKTTSVGAVAETRRKNEARWIQG
jgi:hypothetical protein